MPFGEDEVFGRIYELAITDPKSLNRRIKQGVTDTSPLIYDYTSIVANGLIINDLRIKAKVRSNSEKSNGSSSPSTITIYNLSEESRRYISVGFSVILKAGYESLDENLGTIYVGQVVNTYTRREGADLLTEIVLADSSFSVRNLKGSRSFGKGVTYREVLQEMLNKVRTSGVPTGVIDTSTSEADRLFEKQDKGFTYSGNIYEEINRLCESIDYRSFFSLGTLYVRPKNFQYNRRAVELLPANIKGEIEPRSSDNKTTSEDELQKSGLIVTTFLDSRITLNTLVNLSDRDKYTGTYMPIEIEHVLDSEGKEWDTRISVLREDV